MAKADTPPRDAGHEPQFLMLEASRNRDTGLGVFPRLPEYSPAADRFEPITLSAVGHVYSYTVIHPNPKTGKPPFALAYVDYPERVRVFGRLDLAEGETPAIGMRAGAVDWEGSYRFVAAGEMTA